MGQKMKLDEAVLYYILMGSAVDFMLVHCYTPLYYLYFKDIKKK